MTIEQIFERDYPFKGRGLNDLAQRIGPLSADIDNRLTTQAEVSILEIGCGYGTSLLQLHERYASRVKLTGINRSADDGASNVLSLNAARLGLAPGSAGSVNIIFADINNGIPVESDSFDLIFSQVAWLYLDDKINALCEVRRLLKAGGSAKIEAFHRPRKNDAFKNLTVFEHAGQAVDEHSALSQFGGIEVRRNEDSTALSFGKDLLIPENLVFRSCRSLKQFSDDYVGIQSFYEFT